MFESSTIYLAHPIDRAGGEDGLLLNQAVRRVAGLLADLGWAVYKPGRAWEVEPPFTSTGAAISDVNEYARRAAAVVVAVVHPRIGSVGVPMELTRSLDAGQPILVVDLGTVEQHGVAMVDLFARVPRMQWSGDRSVTGLHAWLTKQLSVIGLKRQEELRALRSQLQEPTPAAAAVAASGGRVKLRRLEDNSNPELWRVGHRGDAGIDLFCSVATVIEPGGWADIPLGVEVQLPPGWWGQLTGRSSTLRDRRLLVSQGVIDNGYRGALFAGVWNLGTEPARVEVGDRIAQLILLPLWRPEVTADVVVEVDRLGPSSRGRSGFGSTGT